MMRRLSMAVALLAALAFGAPAAVAHAILVQSTPAANASVAGPTVSFALRYNSRLDKSLSKLVLIGADKTETALPIVPGGAEDMLAASADLPAGSYRLRWQVLAIDGHITRGDVPFTVTAAP
jgi:methionine-rich copper-binding protein CopC